MNEKDQNMAIEMPHLEKFIKDYKPGEIIFRENDAGDRMYVILEGQVSIFKSIAASSNRLLITLQKGDFFGEMALLEGLPRSASAVAQGETKLLAMNEAAFYNFLEKNPEFGPKVIRNLIGRLRNANRIIAQSIGSNPNKVVMDGFREYSRQKGIPCRAGLRVNQEDFCFWAAQNLGLNEKAVAENLRNLVERGTILTSALGENELVYPLIKKD